MSGFVRGPSNELADLIGTGRAVYRCLALLALGLSFGAGCLYLRGLDLHGLSPVAVTAAWGVLCLSQAVGIWAAVWTCVLQGTGYVGWDSILASAANSVTLLVQIVAVLFGGGLLSLAVLAAGGALLQRLLIVRFIRRRKPELAQQRGRWNSTLFGELTGPALRAWLTSVGYLLVANTDQLFIAAQQGTAALPAYRAAFLLVINLHLLAGVFAGASQVFVSQLWQAGEVSQIRVLLRRNARVGLAAMACGAGAILALGPTLFEVWLGQGNFVGYPVLGIFLATFILEHHANVFGSCGRATNDEAYAFSSIATGIVKLLLAWVLTSRLGLLGLALSTLIAQAAINDWFMVYRSVKRLRVGFGEHVREVLVPVVWLFLMALAAGVSLNQLIPQELPKTRVAAVCLITAAVLGAALWRLALDRCERTRVLQRVGFAV